MNQAFNLTQSHLAATVDRYGILKAQAAGIAESLEAIKLDLIETCGESKIEGDIFRLSLSHSLRSTTDWKAIAMTMARKAGVTEKAFDTAVGLHTVATPSWVARCSARVTKGA